MLMPSWMFYITCEATCKNSLADDLAHLLYFVWKVQNEPNLAVPGPIPKIESSKASGEMRLNYIIQKVTYPSFYNIFSFIYRYCMEVTK